MSKSNYDSASQQRILAMVLVLAGNEFDGLAPKEISRAMKIGPSTVTRDLHNLREAGFAEQIQSTGRWRLGPKPIQIATAFLEALNRAESGLREVSQRFTGDTQAP